MQFSPEAMALLGAGTAMLDPRGTYGSFGAAANNAMRAGLGTYLPIKQEARRNELESQRAKLQEAQLNSLNRKQQYQDMILGQFQGGEIPQGDQAGMFGVPQNVMQAMVLGEAAGMPGIGTAAMKQWEQNQPQKRPWWAGQDGQIDPAMLAKEQAGATNVNQSVNTAPPLTPGQKATDSAYGKEYSTWAAGGGYADSLKQINQLQTVIDDLGDPEKNLTGPWISILPDFVRSRTNPESMNAQQLVEEVVQRNLRQVLGAQFTEKEGERLISRAYNPSLDEATNKQRLGNLLNQMKQAVETKADAARYFEQNGTLRGWQGKLPSLSDFDPTKNAKASGKIRRYNPETGKIE